MFKVLLFFLNAFLITLSYSQELDHAPSLDGEALVGRLKSDENFRIENQIIQQRAKILRDLASLKETNPSKFIEVMSEISRQKNFSKLSIYLDNTLAPAALGASGAYSGFSSVRETQLKTSISFTALGSILGIGSGFGILSDLDKASAQESHLKHELKSWDKTELDKTVRIISAFYSAALNLDPARKVQIESKLETEILLSQSRGLQVDLNKVFSPEEITRMGVLNEVARELELKIKEKENL